MRHERIWGRIANELRGWKNEGAIVFKHKGWLTSCGPIGFERNYQPLGFLVRGRRTNPRTKRGYVILEIVS